jgi:hypothetical protein
MKEQGPQQDFLFVNYKILLIGIGVHSDLF